VIWPISFKPLLHLPAVTSNSSIAKRFSLSITLSANRQLRTARPLSTSAAAQFAPPSNGRTAIDTAIFPLQEVRGPSEYNAHVQNWRICAVQSYK
jgi:hypothetical protein